MGDMADYYADQYYDHDMVCEDREDDDGPPMSFKTCRYCGEGDLTWMLTDKGWRLGSFGKLHVCSMKSEKLKEIFSNPEYRAGAEAALARGLAKAMSLPPRYVPPHRNGMNDYDWAKLQRDRPSRFMVGDVVEFEEGGIGMITGRAAADNGWPEKFSVEAIKGKPFHPLSKNAWHYDGDIKRLVAPSALRGL